MTPSYPGGRGHGVWGQLLVSWREAPRGQRAGGGHTRPSAVPRVVVRDGKAMRDCFFVLAGRCVYGVIPVSLASHLFQQTKQNRPSAGGFSPPYGAGRAGCPCCVRAPGPTCPGPRFLRAARCNAHGSLPACSVFRGTAAVGWRRATACGCLASLPVTPSRAKCKTR